MFRRFPYTGWLVLAALLWTVLSLMSWRNRAQLTPQALTEKVAKDFREREAALGTLLQNTEIFQGMYDGTLTTEEVKELAEQPFHIYAFDGDTLFFWNNNTVIATCRQDSLLAEHNTLFRSNGTFLKKCIALPFMEASKSLVILFPIRYDFPFENQYLQSQFAASELIPLTTEVTHKPDSTTYTVTNLEGSPAFYLRFRVQDLPVWIPDGAMLAAILGAVIITLSWINLIAVGLARRRRPVHGLLWIIGCIGLLQICIHSFRLPFNLSTLLIFSPELYASGMFLPSLGILILNMLCLLWVIIFILSWFPAFDLGRLSIPWQRAVATVSVVLVLVTCAFFPADLISNLIINSNISFDVSHFYTINSYSVAGLFTVALIACSCAFLVFLLYLQLTRLIAGRWLRYLCITGAGAVILLLEGSETPDYEYFGLAWLMLFMILLDFRKRGRGHGLFAPNMIFWAAFVAVFATLAVHHFFEIREDRDRRFFAERVVNQRDNVMEFVFTDVSKRLSADKMVRAYLDTPEEETRVVLDEHIGTSYLHGPLSRYDTRIYLFDSAGNAIFNRDTTSQSHLRQLAEGSLPVGFSLYFNDNASNPGYIGSIAVEDSVRSLGQVFLVMNLKRSANETVYPELLQPGIVRVIKPAREYTYAVYAGGELASQTNDYPFPAYIEADTLKPGNSVTIHSADYAAFYYKVEPDKTVVVMDPHNMLLEMITLFSYLLGILIVFGLIAFLFRFYFHYLFHTDERVLQLTLRKRIHFAMLGLVFISFLIIGTVTILFFVERYEANNRTRLQTVMQVLERSILQYLRDGGALRDAYTFNQEIERPAFRSFINNISSSQSIDINVYNSYGALQTTSQDDIYNKAILARIMMPDAYYELSTRRRSMLIQEERIGNLNYLSCYVPLKNDNGVTLGYINVPFFASERELNYQISNILVALINLYAFIFLISSLLAVLITTWLTRTLQIIIQRFEQFSLTGKNQLLEWPYEDEIGVLIREYNKMVRKVEENAAIMARSERESAWREMAQQVAHEIKNPLTPMKLNIQYLQQALKANHPNVRQLTENVSESLIEQINNLSHIASAFSDFAKMPEARPELIDVNDLLHKATELYLNEASLRVSFIPSAEAVRITADKSQLLRVFTNLLQNAAQAIPEDRLGLVRVRVQKEEDHVLIEVADNGTGIPEDVRDRIFSPYFTTKGSGTGLGLAMTRKIIEFWKGSIWFETEEGKGTQFFIRMPLAE